MGPPAIRTRRSGTRSLSRAAASITWSCPLYGTSIPTDPIVGGDGFPARGSRRAAGRAGGSTPSRRRSGTAAATASLDRDDPGAGARERAGEPPVVGEVDLLPHDRRARHPRRGDAQDGGLDADGEDDVRLDPREQPPEGAVEAGGASAGWGGPTIGVDRHRDAHGLEPRHGRTRRQHERLELHIGRCVFEQRQRGELRAPRLPRPEHHECPGRRRHAARLSQQEFVRDFHA